MKINQRFWLLHNMHNRGVIFTIFTIFRSDRGTYKNLNFIRHSVRQHNKKNFRFEIVSFINFHNPLWIKSFGKRNLILVQFVSSAESIFYSKQYEFWKWRLVKSISAINKRINWFFFSLVKWICWVNNFRRDAEQKLSTAELTEMK